MAPGAKILLVEASSANDSDLFTAVNTARNYPGVSVISMSWGGDESSSDLSHNASFTTPAGHSPITFVASSGDTGAYGARGSKIAGYPAASPNVLAVGGTSLSVDSVGNYLSESGWGSGSTSFFNGGSGGGISKFQSQPDYQHGIVTQSTTFRALPDVAFLGDPDTGVAVYDSYDSPADPWIKIGGTSLAAPMWAGLLAIADQGRLLNGLPALDGIHDTLPMLYDLPASDFHDITTGNNGFPAGPGFDLVTGRGTPIVDRVVAGLIGSPIPVTPVPLIASFTVNPAVVLSGVTATLSTSGVTESTGDATIVSIKFYRETNGSDDLQPGQDLFLGNGINVGATWTLNTSTTAFDGGSYTYYALATDSDGAQTIARASLNVVRPTIGALAASPSPTSQGTAVTLTASEVAELAGGSVTSVDFFRESNNVEGFQSDADTFLGSGVRSGDAWSLPLPTDDLPPGSYTLYALAHDAVGISSDVASTLLVIAPPPASNNNFAAAIPVSGPDAVLTGSNVSATREPGEPSIARNRGGASVWWDWTAPGTGVVTIDTHGSSFDTLLGAYTGKSVAHLKLIASNDDGSFTDSTSAISFHAKAGILYHLRVDGFSGASGDILLTVHQTLPPPNNNFANAAPLDANSSPGFGPLATWTGTNLGASRETSEPRIRSNRGGASVWFLWTPQVSQTVTVDTFGSSFDTLLGIYTGAKLSALKLVASNDDANGGTLTSAVTFDAVAGTTYHIAVDGFGGSTGNVVLHLV
jgi:hypothetical protein